MQASIVSSPVSSAADSQAVLKEEVNQVTEAYDDSLLRKSLDDHAVMIADLCRQLEEQVGGSHNLLSVFLTIMRTIG